MTYHQRALQLARTTGWGPTAISRQLAQEGIPVSRQTVGRWLMRARAASRIGPAGSVPPSMALPGAPLLNRARFAAQSTTRVAS